MFIKSDGSLWDVRGNYNAILGDGTSISKSLPQQVVLNGVTNIAAGGESYFIKNDGSLWVMGLWPTEIVTNDVTAVSAKYEDMLFVKSDGSLWASGWNLYGQLGDGTFINSGIEKIVTNNVVAAAAGYFHSLFLKSDGSLWAMGDNTYGQLDDGTNNRTNKPEEVVASGVVAIAAGRAHSLFLKSDGSLWAMGEDVDWQNHTVSFTRKKTGVPVIVHLDAAALNVFKDLPAEGGLFPYLARVRAGDRATEFGQRCRQLGITGVTLHSYRYAWAERAKTVGYPERFAQEALGHNSKAVHRAYAKRALMKITSLEEYEQQAAVDRPKESGR